ncbi:hypothetical protein Xhom_04433 [Xenorhabdus hominickii]|uniref:Uncharacterized protein n=1 Tax=Xenorhabdus hominickii TaxID=351679 RepID=A0A1V0M452_XENHO|nr:hypothetical protein [Xenorhabdus hominickii]PHM52356.1 hypothetical protein Xhom_04433 [Xenorhabdus hominickii]
MIGCFGSITTASAKSPLCQSCNHKEACHAEAQERMIVIFGKFDGFPNDGAGKRGKKNASTTS